MNVLHYNTDHSLIGQFAKEFDYNSETSPSNSIESDSSEQQRINYLNQTNLMDNWNGNGDFNDNNDVKDILRAVQVETDNSKQVVAFHHLPRNVCPTICAVCGDRASGYHYEVPSCNGCKTFFRRTILSQRKYECSREGKCFNVLPKEKRCSCRSCRFAKCVEVGMNPYAIQTANKLEENKIVTKIAGKRKTVEDEALVPSTSKLTASIDVLSFDQSIEQLISGLLYLDIKVENFRKCAFNPEIDAVPKLANLLDQHSLIAVADKVGPMPNWPLPQWTHEDHERYRKAGCRGAVERKNWFFFDILASVEYAKTFMFMHHIEKSDQILLLRAVTLKLMNLHQSFYSYENKYEGILHPDGTIAGFPHHPKKSMPPGAEERLKSWLAPVRMLIRNQLDKQEYVLFKAITLCNATITGLSEHAQEIVTNEKEKFSNALLKYCLAKRGPNGPAHYAACLALSNSLETHQKNQKDIHLLMRITKNGHAKRPLNELLEDIME